MLDTLKDYAIPLLSFAFSSVAFFLTVRSEYSKKFKMELSLVDEPIELLVDRFANDNPDPYFQNKYRFMPVVTITNTSSLPFTVTEFSFSKENKFSRFTLIGAAYQVTTRPTSKKEGALVAGYGRSKTIVYEFDDIKPIRPTFTINPYESVVGVLFFHYDNSLVGKQKLTIKTSRGTKDFDITISKQYVSQAQTDYVPPQLE